ncbi:MAG TPA: hypothetical protein VLC30_14345, partial [Pseudomonas sp.]|nr:hypothetical protein [Pseudomonas sp.]
PQATYLRGAMQAACAVTVQPLLEKGLQGAELGEALKLERHKALKTDKASAPPCRSELARDALGCRDREQARSYKGAG